MNLYCTLLLLGTLTLHAHARNDNYFGGKLHSASSRYALQNKYGGSSVNSLSASNGRASAGAYNNQDAKIPILRNDQQMKDDGSYRYEYETANGISGMEQGTGGVAVQGLSSYVSPEGVPIKLSYTADETGYHPIGDHIPKTPDYILRALEYIRTHPFKVQDSQRRSGSIQSAARFGASKPIPPLSIEIAPPPRTPSHARNTLTTTRRSASASAKGSNYIKVQQLPSRNQYQNSRNAGGKRRF